MFNFEYETIRVDKRTIPAGARLVEAYETDREIIVMGEPPDSEDEETGHNCDALGCGSLGHVAYRLRKPSTSAPPTPAAAGEAGER